MRENWSRAEQQLKLHDSELQKLLEPAFPGARILHSQLASGGLANTNIRVVMHDQKAPVMVRLWTRDGSQAEKEFRINSAIHDQVPTPDFFHFSSTNPVNGVPYAIMQWFDAPRFELVWNKLSGKEMLQLAGSLGQVMQAIHSFKFPQTGMLDSKLKVAEPLQIGASGMLAFTRECLIEKNGATHLSDDFTERIFNFVAECGPLLDEWKAKPCLTHSDFGGSNILVHDVGRGWEVAAVLDWEFAFSGTPLFDFGNLLRPPLGSMENFARALVESYRKNGGELPDDWQRLIRLVDLSAWFDFLARPNVTAEVVTDAKSVIADTIDLFEQI
ncbi:MAG TPA: phosphotransferase [Drouetiella sp.]